MPWQPGKQTNKPTNMQTVQRVADSGNSASSCGRRFAAVERAHEEVSKRAPERVRVCMRVRACVCVGWRVCICGVGGCEHRRPSVPQCPGRQVMDFPSAYRDLRELFELQQARSTAPAQSWSRCGRGEPSPGADVAGASRVPAQMWQGRAESRCRCGRGEPSPGADVVRGRAESRVLCRLSPTQPIVHGRPQRTVVRNMHAPISSPIAMAKSALVCVALTGTSSRVPVKMWQPRCRCGSSPGADVAEVSRVPAQMWQR